MAPTTTSHGDFQFTATIDEVSFAASGDPDLKGTWTMRGHAAVFNRKSHDLGGFRTVIRPGAFTNVLDGNPDVHLVLNHDMRWVLARTKNNTLELREDPYGLHVWARIAPTTYANDLRISMERGDIDQMSFACDIGDDEWVEDKDGITRYINGITGLYDATVCPQGAFPQTDAQLVASLHTDAGALLASAQEAGRVIRREQDTDLVAARGEDGDGIAPPEGVADVADQYQARLAALQERAASAAF